jgi:hypothetical protein
MRILVTFLAVLVFAEIGNAQTSISSFAYSYDWTGAAGFTTLVGRAYTGGDGHWACYAFGTKQQYAADPINGLVQTNSKSTDDTLFCIVDATGISFTGGEVFKFDAKKSGGTGIATLVVKANSTQILSKTDADLTTSMQSFTSDPFPSALSGTVFTLYIIINTDGVISLDNTKITGGALPITLASFNLSSGSGSVTLNWTTLSEINNYGFFVQKCDDLKSWTDAANSFQPGYGTTIEQHFYSYTDNTQPLGKYYRLRQVDLDGTNHFSDALSDAATSVDPTTVAKEFALYQSYPNPCNPKAVVSSQLPVASHVRLTVYDALGREVAVMVDEQRAAGSYRDTFDGSGLASGVYYYRLTAGRFTDTKTMVLMK